jgi:hypothetical protein
MPEGLFNALEIEEIADLMAYLSSSPTQTTASNPEPAPDPNR